MSSKVCRIVLADDHALIRAGIRNLLNEEEGMEVVGEVGDGLELLHLLKYKMPDLILLDISMPNLRGIEAINEIRKLDQEVKILILTMHKSDQYLCSALAAGANGYLLKEDSDTELVPAIAKVMRGEFFVSPILAEDFSDDRVNSCREHRQGSVDALTIRERQVLKLAAEGETSKEIAALLSISRRTVEHHRANLMRKLNIKNSAELVKYAISKSYVAPPEVNDKK